MTRWIVGGIAVLLMVVLFILWNSADRAEQSTVRQAIETNDNRQGNTEEKPTPKIANHLAAPAAENQITSNQKTDREPEIEQNDKMVEMARPKRGGPLKILKSVYEDETRDETANKTEKLIRDKFGSEHLPAEFFHNVTCHKSVCRVDMYWTEKNPFVLMALAMELGRSLTTFIAFDPDPEPDREGRTMVTVYILRKGDISDL